jgi:OOP family OmpA-OmpF porin
MVLGAVLATQLGGGSEDPAAAARRAIAEGGLPAVTVAVDNGTATLTGSIPSQDVAEAIAAAVASVDGVAAVNSNLSVPAPTPTTIPSPAPDPSDTARAALAGAGLATVEVNVESGVAVLTGTITSDFERRSAVSAVSAVVGVDQIDSQLIVASLPDDTIESAARAALDEGGFSDIAVSVQDAVAIVAGTVPPEVLGGGFFRYSDEVEDAVLRVPGVAGLINRLQLAGDEATLRRQLRELTDASPVVFSVGRADLSAAAAATLDAAAEIIQAQPGLRVLIAGHTDTTGSAGFNEALSGERAQAVRSYLLEQGIAVNRLLVVAYGELFPTTPGVQPADRRVEFEVAG